MHVIIVFYRVHVIQRVTMYVTKLSLIKLCYKI